MPAGSQARSLLQPAANGYKPDRALFFRLEVPARIPPAFWRASQRADQRDAGRSRILLLLHSRPPYRPLIFIPLDKPFSPFPCAPPPPTSSSSNEDRRRIHS